MQQIPFSFYFPQKKSRASADILMIFPLHYGKFKILIKKSELPYVFWILKKIEFQAKYKTQLK
jgi:hypothetical protein